MPEPTATRKNGEHGSTETSLEKTIVEAVCTRGVEFARGIMFASTLSPGLLDKCVLTRDLLKIKNVFTGGMGLLAGVPELS